MFISYTIVVLVSKHQVPSNSSNIITNINFNDIVSISPACGVHFHLYIEYYTETTKFVEDYLKPRNQNDYVFKHIYYTYQVMINHIAIYPLPYILT
jgi:hypothetical protein